MALGRRSIDGNIFSCTELFCPSHYKSRNCGMYLQNLAVEWIIFASAFQAVILDRWWEILSFLRLLRFREENQKGESVGTSFPTCIFERREPFPLLPVIGTLSQLVAQQRCILVTRNGKRVIFY